MEIKEVEYIKDGFFGFFRKPLIGVSVYIDENESKKPAWEISRAVEMEGKLDNKRYLILRIQPKTLFSKIDNIPKFTTLPTEAEHNSRFPIRLRSSKSKKSITEI